MKKFVVCLITVVIIILIVILLKNFTTAKYSNDDIKNLITKGMETIDDINNMYLEKETETGIAKFYYKGNKRKMEGCINTDGIKTRPYSTITNLDEEKNYMISNEEKLIFVNTPATIGKGTQYDILQLGNYSYAMYVFKFTYIKDEKIDNKDCIFVKGQLFNTETREYSDYSYNPENEIPVCWIEKSTGFVIATALMQPDTNTATPETIIRNIKFGEVTDNDFKLPDGYKVIEK